MQVDTKPKTKAGMVAHLKAVMLAECDADIQQVFQEHGYTLEPLLMQLLRELRRAQDRGPAEPSLLPMQLAHLRQVRDDPMTQDPTAEHLRALQPAKEPYDSHA